MTALFSVTVTPSAMDILYWPASSPWSVMSLSTVTSPVSVARSPSQAGAGTIVRVRPSALVVSRRLSSTEILSTPIVSIGVLPPPPLMAMTLSMPASMAISGQLAAGPPMPAEP